MKKHRVFKASLPCAIACLTLCALALFHFPASSERSTEFPFKTNDRVAWIGSSSTRIGTWCRTLEFLLRTRHPELHLAFNRGTTGGGTFLTGVKNLPVWLNDFKPTYVLFNYGGNDAGAGAKGVAAFKLNMQKCAELVLDTNARLGFTTHQSGDVRVTAPLPYEARRLYAEEMLKFAREKDWTVYDSHHALEAYQLNEQLEVPDFTINKDRIHLTDSAYVAWGFFLYERMNPPDVESAAELTADGAVSAQRGCKISEISYTPGVLEFVREDSVLPLLPPNPIPAGNALKTVPPPGANPATSAAASAIGAALQDAKRDYLKPSVPAINSVALNPAVQAPAPVPAPAIGPAVATGTPAVPAAPKTPPFKIPPAQVQYAAKRGQELPPRKLVPLEKFSRYMLKVAGLEAGDYQISCDGKPIGTASAKELADSVNLNALLLDAKNPAPWAELSKSLWLGLRLDEIGATKFKFKVEKL